MNGRVYDYNIGRFLSVDPFVHLQGGSQGINPYSYIMNNPMAGIDPTGYVPIIPLIIWGYSAYETANAASDAYDSYQNGDITGADAATAVGVSAIESTVGKKVKLAKQGLQKVRQAFKGDKPNSNVQNSTNASNTDGGTKVTNGQDNTQGGNSAGQKTTDIGSQTVTAKDIRRGEGGTLFKKNREEALKDNGGMCELCGERKSSQGDHLKPVKSFADDVNAGKKTLQQARVEANSLQNIAGACGGKSGCNPTKGSKQLSSTEGPGLYVPKNPSAKVTGVVRVSGRIESNKLKEQDR
jgi:hypothetical protein